MVKKITIVPVATGYKIRRKVVKMKRGHKMEARCR